MLASRWTENGYRQAVEQSAAVASELGRFPPHWNRDGIPESLGL